MKNLGFTEEEAREKRYEFFDKVLKKYNSKYLFTAHHGDDLIETIQETLRIQKEGKEKRRNAEIELSVMEEDLKNKLLEMSNQN